MSLLEVVDDMKQELINDHDHVNYVSAVCLLTVKDGTRQELIIMLFKKYFNFLVGVEVYVLLSPGHQTYVPAHI